MTLPAPELRPPAPAATPEPKPAAPDHKDPKKAAEPAKAVAPKSKEIYEYPAELPPMPANTSHALDGAKNDLIRGNLEGEQRRSIGQATVPFVVGAAAEIIRPKGHFFGSIYNAILGGPLGVVAGDLAGKAGGLVGLSVEMKKAAENLVSAGSAGAIATMALTPSISIMKRVLFGENAWKQAASFMVRKEDGGILSRIIHGGESRLLKWSMFSENASRRQLLRFADQNVDVNNLIVGNKSRLEDLIAEGMVAGATSQMMTELNVPLSAREAEKMERMNRAYDMAKKLFDSKITTAGQREIFLNDKLPGLMRNKERMMWAKQTGLITAVGMAKAVSMVGLLQAFDLSNITRLRIMAEQVGGGFVTWGKGIYVQVQAGWAAVTGWAAGGP